MVFQGKTIISLWDIMVRSFGSNNCWIRRIQPWFDPSDPTIISDKNVEKGFRDIMVRSFGSNNCSIRRIQPWSDNQLLLFFPFFCYNKKYKQKYFVSIFVSKIYFLKRYKLYRIITKSTNKIL